MGITPYFIFLGRKRPLRNNNCSNINTDKLVKSLFEVLRWIWKKYDIQVSDHRETPRRRFCAAYRIVTSGAAKVSIVARAKDISILFYLVRVCK
jgi:hypothetical protein